VVEEDLDFLEEDFLLYSKYQKIRHNDLSSSLEDQREEYKNFLLTSNFISKKIRFYHNDNLIMVSIVDYLNDGISAVYTFYDRNYLKQSLGTYSILWLIEKCKRENLPYLYLGYWIKENDKMNYKTKFKPFELFEDKQWKIFNE
jgi:arginine-tRNA-protein transferase